MQGDSRNRKRSGCLTVSLLFLFITYLLISYHYLFAIRQLPQNKLELMPESWYFNGLGIIGILYCICLIALFVKKRLGLYGWGVITLINFGLTLIAGMLSVEVIFYNLLIYGVLILLIRPSWKGMR
jgi:hypothetical protein